jgi:hypothetical protein
MTFREMNVNVFAGKPVPHIFFQPRLEPWYDWHKTFGNLPARYQGRSLLEFLDDLQVSMRYTHYYTEMPYPIVQSISPQVKVHEKITADEKTIVYETPYGDLTETSRLTVDKTWREIGFPAKKPDDLKKLGSLGIAVIVSQ